MGVAGSSVVGGRARGHTRPLQGSPPRGTTLTSQGKDENLTYEVNGGHKTVDSAATAAAWAAVKFAPL